MTTCRRWTTTTCAAAGRTPRTKKFDEATAILAGDGLLTFAHSTCPGAGHETASRRVDPRIALVLGLARAAGVGGMVGGQMLDLAARGPVRPQADTPQGEKDVLTLQAMKTGAILKFCCVAGAILGNAPQAKREAAGRYGQVIGQAFLQIAGRSALRRGRRRRHARQVGRRSDRRPRQGHAGRSARHHRRTGAPGAARQRRRDRAQAVRRRRRHP